jgi:pSer/pThr/pTyr-binding forkhead associated (FHA) protein
VLGQCETHSEIEQANGIFIVRDVGSLNGTYLNQKRVEQANIHNGDELQVGKFRLLFLEGPDQS